MNRIDIIKSLLRGSVYTTNQMLRRVRLPSSIQTAFQDAINRNIRLRDQQMTVAVGRVKSIRAVTVKVSQGRILIDAALVDGGTLTAAITPVSAIFAPRGAKDLCFRVDPPDTANNRVLADIMGAVAVDIARLIWGPLIYQKNRSEAHAIVEQDGDLLRIDLRTVPEVRKAINQGAKALFIDAMTVKKMTAEEGALCLTLGLQGLP